MWVLRIAKILIFTKYKEVFHITSLSDKQEASMFLDYLILTIEVIILIFESLK